MLKAETGATAPAGTDNGTTPRQHREKGQEAIREAVSSLRKAQTLFIHAQDLYGPEKGNLAIYQETAGFYAERIEDLTQRAQRMIDPEYGE